MSDTTTEIDFNTLSLEEQLDHKVWKARVIGYENLTKLLTKNKNNSNELMNIYKSYKLDSFINESNMVALEKGLETIYTFLLFYNDSDDSICSDILPRLINKAICSSPRKLTRETGISILIELVKINKNVNDFIDITLINYDLLGNKKIDKIINGISIILLTIFHNFQTLPINSETLENLLKLLLVLSQHSNIKIRKDAFSCLAIIDSLIVGKDLIEDLVFTKWKPIQLKEFVKYKETWIKERDDVEKMEMNKNIKNENDFEKEDNENDVDMVIEEEHEVKIEPVVDPWVNKRSTKILNQDMLIESQFREELMDSDWKIRVERLNETLKMIEKIRKLDYILEDYTTIFNALASRIVKDTNLQVVHLSIELGIKMFRLIRDGHYLVKYISIILQPMLTRLKDKKVCQFIKDTVMEIVEFHPSKLGCCLDIFLTKFLNHKVLQERYESLALLNQLMMKYCKSVNNLLPIQRVDEFLPTIIKFCSEAQPNVRQEGFKFLAIIMEFVVDGEDEIMPILESKLDSLKVKKIVQLKNEIDASVSNDNTNNNDKNISNTSGKKRPAESPLKFENKTRTNGIKLHKPSPTEEENMINPVNLKPQLKQDVAKPEVIYKKEIVKIVDEKLVNENENLKFQLSRANNENLLLSKQLEKIKKEIERIKQNENNTEKENQLLKQENEELKNQINDLNERKVSGMSSYATNISYPKSRNSLSPESVISLSDGKRIDSMRLSSINSIMSNESIDEFYSKNIKQNDDLKEKVGRIREKIRNISLNSNK